MFYFYTEYLGFSPEFLGNLKFVYALAALLSVIIYNKYLGDVEFKKQFIVISTLCFLFQLS
jgi:hypothetical protein